MARQDYDLELRRYNGQGWRAIFFQSGFEHSLTSHARCRVGAESVRCSLADGQRCALRTPRRRCFSISLDDDQRLATMTFP